MPRRVLRVFNVSRISSMVVDVGSEIIATQSVFFVLLKAGRRADKPS